MKLAVPQDLFLPGMLADIGMLALNATAPAEYAPILAGAGGSHAALIDREIAALGADHAAVGAWLLQTWRLPERICALVAASHDTTAPEPGAKCVALAGIIAAIWCEKDAGQAAQFAAGATRSCLGLSSEAFDAILADVAATLPAENSNLDVKFATEDAINDLLETAREALVGLNLAAQKEVRTAEEKSNIDPLTLLQNRSYLDNYLPQCFEAAIARDEPLTVLFADVDHFKKVNDTYGHQAGDAILVAVGRVLRSAIRDVDVAIRYGGEEFLIVLPNTPASRAHLIGERIRAAMAGHKHAIGQGTEIHVTCSVGVATMNHGDFSSASALIDAADRCVYAAKHGGRNRVVMMGPEGAPAPQSGQFAAAVPAALRRPA
jgi:diguanylate cyclase (GGDEF)-like protein